MYTIRNLEGPIIDCGQSTKYLIFFLHGWGSDGNDLLQIGEIWKNELPTATFIAPNGPEFCKSNPTGRQWFDILDSNEDSIMKGLHKSYLDIKNFITINLDKYKLGSNQYFLVGFSQGTMLALYFSLIEKLLGVVGYSGAFLGNIPQNTAPKNDYLLLHGENDSIVPVEKMHKAIEKLKNISNSLESKVFSNLEHSINEEGLKFGLNFIKNKTRVR